MSLANLIAAARLAREASQGRRTIELVVTEEGVMVRGWTRVGAQQMASTMAVHWPQLSAPQDFASEAVDAVDRKLSAMEGAS